MVVEIHQSDSNGNIVRVIEPIKIQWRDREFTIPAQFNSDGMSVPQFLWSSISPAIDYRSLKAALSHDYIYRVQPSDWTRAEADKMCYDFCREGGLGWWRSQKVYWGLRLFGWCAWSENAKQLKESDAHDSNR